MNGKRDLRSITWLPGRLLLTAVLACLAAPAFSLSCGEPTPPLRLIDEAPIILSGTVVSSTSPSSTPYPSAITTVVVTDRLKGPVPDRVTARTRPYRAGETDTFFLYPPTSSADGLGLSDGGPCSSYGPQRAAVDRLLSEFRVERDRVAAALSAEPAAFAHRLARARFLERLRDPAALDAYAALGTEAPGSVHPPLGMARILLRLDRPAEAGAHLARARALTPSDGEEVRLLAHARLMAGEREALDGLRDFRGLDMQLLDLSWRDLRGADFSGARVGTLDLTGADLRGARFDGARLSETILARADFRGGSLVRLTEAVLPRVLFGGVPRVRSLNLSGARLDGADLAGVNLAGIDLQGASLRNATAPDANLGGANLMGAALDGASLPGANLHRADLRGANMAGTRLVGANLGWSDLAGTDLSRADIRGASFDLAFYDCGTRLPRGATPERLGMTLRDPTAPPCR